MIDSTSKRKIVIPLVGLISGILLFLASFSILLNNVIYNSEFQKNAFEKQGLYESVSQQAEVILSEINISQSQLEPIIRNTTTLDLVSTNLKSLIEGLINYFKGNTDSLPDLYLNSVIDGEHISTLSVQPFANIEKINLNVLFMVSGERHISDLMLVVSLLQFILKYTPIFSLMFFITLFILLLNKSPFELRIWLQSTIITYLILCLASGLLIPLALYSVLPHLLYFSDKLEYIPQNVLSGYITYCANTLSMQLILSGIIVSGGVKAANLLLKSIYQSEAFNNYSFSDLAHTTRISKKMSAALFAILVLSSVVFYAQINVASQRFIDRNLTRAISVFNGETGFYRVTDARNDSVYLLDVKVLDSITKLPVQNWSARVRTNNESEIEPALCYTTSDNSEDSEDLNDSSVFLLDQGNFKLVLDFVGTQKSFNQYSFLSYDFEMNTPGKSELTVLLDSQTDNLPFIKEATLQYIP